MASVEDFLSANPEFAVEDVAGSSAGDVRLDVTLIGVSPGQVRFTHLGTEYAVDRDHVVSIEPRGDRSRDVVVTLRRDASLVAVHAVRADALTAPVPFGMLRPVPPRVLVPSERELAWRTATGYAGRYPSLEIYLQPFETQSRCDSESGGIHDDTIADEAHADY